MILDILQRLLSHGASQGRRASPALYDIARDSDKWTTPQKQYRSSYEHITDSSGASAYVQKEARRNADRINSYRKSALTTVDRQMIKATQGLQYRAVREEDLKTVGSDGTIGNTKQL